MGWTGLGGVKSILDWGWECGVLRGRVRKGECDFWELKLTLLPSIFDGVRVLLWVKRAMGASFLLMEDCVCAN
jgi:hypothetical protein